MLSKSTSCEDEYGYEIKTVKKRRVKKIKKKRYVRPDVVPCYMQSGVSSYMDDDLENEE